MLSNVHLSGHQMSARAVVKFFEKFEASSLSNLSTTECEGNHHGKASCPRERPGPN